MAPAALIEMALAALGLVEIYLAVSLYQRDGALDAGQFARVQHWRSPITTLPSNVETLWQVPPSLCVEMRKAI